MASEPSEFEVLKKALEILFESVPMCGCCGSDDEYMDIRNRILAEAKKVGLDVKHVPDKNEDPHDAKYYTYRVVVK